MLFRSGVEYIVRAHCKKLNISLVNAGKMKRLVNASKNFVLLMIKKKDDVDYEYFDGCDEKMKSELFDVVSQHGEMFQEPKGLPPKHWYLSHVNYGEFGNQEANPRVSKQRYHTPIYFAMWFSNSFGSKEGWDLAHVYRFSCTEQNHAKESQSTSMY